MAIGLGRDGAEPGQDASPKSSIDFDLARITLGFYWQVVVDENGGPFGIEGPLKHYL
jgi:hypothetical protein